MPEREVRPAVDPAHRPSPTYEAAREEPGATLPRAVPADPAPPDHRPTTRRIRWAVLLQRVFAIDALSCPRCGSTLRLVAAIEDPVVARAILESMGLPARAPPEIGASPEPPDQIPSLDDTPSYDFDQSSPYEDG